VGGLDGRAPGIVGPSDFGGDAGMVLAEGRPVWVKIVQVADLRKDLREYAVCDVLSLRKLP
jgi:hypothetical protein